jgi:hypothetical protein
MLSNFELEAQGKGKGVFGAALPNTASPTSTRGLGQRPQHSAGPRMINEASLHQRRVGGINVLYHLDIGDAGVCELGSKHGNELLLAEVLGFRKVHTSRCDGIVCKLRQA